MQNQRMTEVQNLGMHNQEMYNQGIYDQEMDNREMYSQGMRGVRNEAMAPNFNAPLTSDVAMNRSSRVVSPGDNTLYDGLPPVVGFVGQHPPPVPPPAPFPSHTRVHQPPVSKAPAV